MTETVYRSLQPAGGEAGVVNRPCAREAQQQRIASQLRPKRKRQCSPIAPDTGLSEQLYSEPPVDLITSGKRRKIPPV